MRYAVILALAASSACTGSGEGVEAVAQVSQAVTVSAKSKLTMERIEGIWDSSAGSASGLTLMPGGTCGYRYKSGTIDRVLLGSCFLEGDVIVMDPIRVDPPADPIILKHQWTFRVLRLEGDSMSIQAQSPMGDTIIRMHRVRENKSE